MVVGIIRDGLMVRVGLHREGDVLAPLHAGDGLHGTTDAGLRAGSRRTEAEDAPPLRRSRAALANRVVSTRLVRRPTEDDFRNATVPPSDSEPSTMSKLDDCA